MSIDKMLLLTGIALTVVPGVFAHPWCFFAVEAFVRLAAIAMLSAGGAL